MEVLPGLVLLEIPGNKLFLSYLFQLPVTDNIPWRGAASSLPLSSRCLLLLLNFEPTHDLNGPLNRKDLFLFLSVVWPGVPEWC